MTDITELAQREKFEAWLEEAEALPWGYLKKRRTSDDAYHEPNTTDMWGAWQAASVEMVEALEAKEKQRAAANKVVIQQDIELNELRQRIAELESRTVTLEPFRSFVTDDDIVALHRFAECCDDPESGGHDLEKEQVRRLEAIGALQRSGRISYITGFGDVLISITAGIQVIEGKGQHGGGF
ncbi:hypothetical protein AB9B48_18080 [Kluyvera ascorbata]|uniref:hypothetical protein n=1 Tax=Kluyvera ascorbata TaxID=51288 RepID=UPI00350EF5F7